MAEPTLDSTEETITDTPDYPTLRPFGERLVDSVTRLLGSYHFALGGGSVAFLWLFVTGLGSSLHWVVPIAFYDLNLSIALLIFFLAFLLGPFTLYRLRQLGDRVTQDADDLYHQLYLVDSKLTREAGLGEQRHAQLLALISRLERKALAIDEALYQMREQEGPRLRRKRRGKEEDGIVEGTEPATAFLAAIPHVGDGQ